MPELTPFVPHGQPRKFSFFVSTTGWASGIRKYLGSAGYSYFFAYEALAPVIERFGPCRLVDQPESRLPWLANQARAEGYEPIHLSINPPQDVYLTPALPTVVYPFWEFSTIPDRDFGDDTRQNWTRVLRKATALVAPCAFTAEALKRDDLPVPLHLVPVPLRPAFFELEDWSPDWKWTYTGRHAVWTDDASDEPEADPEAPPVAESVSDAPVAPQPRKRGVAKRAFDKVAPRIGPRAVHVICTWKRRVVPGQGDTFVRLQYRNARTAYYRYVRRWLSHEAVTKVSSVKHRMLGRFKRPEEIQTLPGLPVGKLTLSGLVYTTIFNISDPRKNPGEILSAFLLAFRDRPDATLVVKLITNPLREHFEVNILRQMYEGMAIRHRCRVVVITDYLSDSEMNDLFRATTFYVNNSFGEGACLPLQQALAGGRPSLAPDHTAMADYVDDKVAFVTRSSPEPINWPHDPERRFETLRFRPLWADLHRNFIESAEMVDTDLARYHAMAAAARRQMAEYAGREVVAEAFKRMLDRLPRQTASALDWAS